MSELKLTGNPGKKEKVNSNQLSLGIKIEMEHTDDKKIAEKIARDHLAEMPDYYTHLKKMEKENMKKAMRRMGKPRTDVERVMNHYNVSREKAEQMLKEKSASELLPARGNGLSKAFFNLGLFKAAGVNLFSHGPGHWVTHNGKHYFVKEGRAATPSTHEDHKISEKHWGKQKEKHSKKMKKLFNEGKFNSKEYKEESEKHSHADEMESHHRRKQGKLTDYERKMAEKEKEKQIKRDYKEDIRRQKEEMDRHRRTVYRKSILKAMQQLSLFDQMDVGSGSKQTRVKAHTRRTKGGKVAMVKEHGMRTKGRKPKMKEKKPIVHDLTKPKQKKPDRFSRLNGDDKKLYEKHWDSFERKNASQTEKKNYYLVKKHTGKHFLMIEDRSDPHKTDRLGPGDPGKLRMKATELAATQERTETLEKMKAKPKDETLYDNPKVNVHDTVYVEDIHDKNKRIPVNFRGWADSLGGRKAVVFSMAMGQMQIPVDRVFHNPIESKETPKTEPKKEEKPKEKSYDEQVADIRADLEKRVGPVWDTDEMTKDFEVKNFSAPYAFVKHKKTGQEGSIEFRSRPRFYYNFIEKKTGKKMESKPGAKKEVDRTPEGYGPGPAKEENGLNLKIKKNRIYDDGSQRIVLEYEPGNSITVDWGTNDKNPSIMDTRGKRYNAININRNAKPGDNIKLKKSHSRLTILPGIAKALRR